MLRKKTSAPSDWKRILGWREQYGNIVDSLFSMHYERAPELQKEAFVAGAICRGFAS
jgi:hypothetical protein